MESEAEDLELELRRVVWDEEEWGILLRNGWVEKRKWLKEVLGLAEEERWISFQASSMVVEDGEEEEEGDYGVEGNHQSMALKCNL